MSQIQNQMVLPLKGAAPELLTPTEMPAAVRMGRSTIYKEIKAGRFPAPIRLSPRRVAWPVTVIQAWVDAQSKPQAATDDVKEGGAR